MIMIIICNNIFPLPLSAVPQRRFAREPDLDPLGTPGAL